MDIRLLEDRTPLARCAQTTVQNELVEALLVNKLQTEKYRSIVPVVANGHGRGFPAKHVLSYLVRRALRIVRRPGTYDLRLESKHFQSFSTDELEEAALEVTRIYEHTQAEMSKYLSQQTIALSRGIDGLEASVYAKLFEEVKEDIIPYYFQTLTFFNHLFTPFRRAIEFKIDCPLEWVWASAYTVKELELPGADEEFLVTCPLPCPVMHVPRQQFTINSKVAPIDRMTSGSTKYLPDSLPEALSALMQEGFEPDDWERPFARYNFGRWEERLMALGRWFDSKAAPHRRNSVRIRSKSAH